jgi:hypothetical protein
MCAQDAAYFAHLQRDGERAFMLTDELVRMDVRATANDDNYFVFEDVVRLAWGCIVVADPSLTTRPPQLDVVLMAFLRDPSVAERCAVPLVTLSGVAKSAHFSSFSPSHRGGA